MTAKYIAVTIVLSNIMMPRSKGKNVLVLAQIHIKFIFVQNPLYIEL